jgi:hypothetical protein
VLHVLFNPDFSPQHRQTTMLFVLLAHMLYGVEMMIEEESVVLADQQQQLMILTNLLHLREQVNAGPRHGELRVGRQRTSI